MQRWLKQIARQRVMGFQLIEAKWVAVSLIDCRVGDREAVKRGMSILQDKE